MKFLQKLKKITLVSIVAITAFLTPVSFNIPTLSMPADDIFSVQSFIHLNTAHAQFIQYECNSSGITEAIACQIGKVISSYYYVIFFVLTQVAAAVTGVILDIVIKFSISSNFYRNSGIIEVGWEILRDITNIVFIFVLLAIAFKMVVGGAGSGAKKSLVNTILLALVVNFSLFMSYAVIDASNILAHVFWNRLDTDVESYQQATPEGETSIDFISFLKSLGVDQTPSIAIAGQINPQNIISGAGGYINFPIAMILVTGAAVLNILLVYVFFSVLLVFFGRILGLIILAVMSPLAFASLAVPQLRKLPFVGFNNWLSELLKLSFMAPVYLFFLWLTVKFISDKGVLGTIATTKAAPGDWFTPLINTFLLLGLIGGMLLMTKKVADLLSKGMGNLAQNAVQKAIGGTIAAGSIAMTGGAAALGGATRLTGAVAGIGAQAGSKRAEFAAGASRAGKQMMSLKADVTKIPGFSSLMGKEATSMIGKVTGTSARDIERRATLGAMKTVEGLRDIRSGRSFQESEFKFEQDKKNIRDNSGKWQDKIFETEAVDKIKNAREQALDNDTFVYPAGHQFAGMTRKQALEQASTDANDPAKISAHRVDVKNKETDIETGETTLATAKQALQTVNNAVSIAKRNTDTAQKDLEAINMKLQAAITSGDRAEANRQRVARAGAETRLNNAKSTESTEMGRQTAAQTAVATAETTLKTLKKDLETLQKQAPDKALAGVKEDIRVNVHLSADRSVAAEYSSKSKEPGDSYDKVSKKIQQGKIKIDDSPSEKK